MFSGIVETVGIINCLKAMHDCLNINITPQKKFIDLTVGDSISINGVCLTITKLLNDSFNVTAVPETIRVTNLEKFCLGSKVNLERSLKADSRIGGHYVQGHVDFKGEILDLKPDGEDALIAKISNPIDYAKYIVNKGYIALDGMSITVIESQPEWFTVTFIPHTQQITIVNQYRKGTHINVEVDIIGKFVEKIVGAHADAITR